MKMGTFTIASVFILTIASVFFLSASKAYDTSLRNVAASVAGGLIGLFLLALIVSLSFGGHSSEEGIIQYAVGILILFGPLIGSFLGIKIFGKESYYYSMRDKEHKGKF